MKKILVMEDDKKIAAALAIRLEAAGYEVLTAPDGFDGLKLALHQRPDLLLMDIWMPVGTGFSVAQRLESLGLSGIPMVFITASKLKGLKQAAQKLGAVGFFEKPYDPAQLLAAIARALEPDPAPRPNQRAISEIGNLNSMLRV
jgi:CheY-like chemotaxis protein